MVNKEAECRASKEAECKAGTAADTEEAVAVGCREHTGGTAADHRHREGRDSECMECNQTPADSQSGSSDTSLEFPFFRRRRQSLQA